MQISDDLMLGPVFSGGPAINPAGGSPMEKGVGPMGRIYLFDVVPFTANPAGYAASQNPASGAGFALTAGNGVTLQAANGVSRYVVDVPRVVTITAAGANTATYTVNGFDQYGQPMSESFAVASTSTVTGKKAFKSVVSVVNNNATAGTNGLTVGFGDVIGLPFRLTDLGYVANMTFNQVVIAVAAPTILIADGNVATPTTGDVRGTVALTATDGIKRLVMGIYLPAIASGPNATRLGAFGVTQA